ncbi:DUF58 domain-containing protein [Paenibacillus yanchengensis]|uniref:DUF58 domain-containing protein n=1 Tax=Paenibacillus yanchengensis TaxID=2035833 RepID=A0ABW4YI97_9BACL
MSRTKRRLPIHKMRPSKRPLRSRYLIWSGIIVIWSVSLYVIVKQQQLALAWLLFVTCSVLVVVSGLFPAIAAMQLRATREIEITYTDHGLNGMQQHDHHATASSAICIATISMKQRFKQGGLWLMIEEKLTNESATSPMLREHLQTLFLPLKMEKQWKLTQHWPALSRGEYRFAPLTVYVGDWLGLTVWKRQLHPAATFLVMPAPLTEWSEQLSIVSWQRALQVTRQKVPLQGQQSMQSTSSRSSGGGTEYRAYTAGDRLFSINMHMLARGQGLYTKQSEQLEQTQRCYILDLYDERQKEHASDKALLIADRLLNQKMAWLLQHIRSSVQQAETAIVILPERQWMVSPSNEIFGELDSSDEPSYIQQQLAKVKLERQQVSATSWLKLYDSLWIHHDFDQLVQIVHVYTSEITVTARWKIVADQLAVDDIQLHLHVVMLSDEWTDAVENHWTKLQDVCGNMDVSWLFVSN